MTITVHYTRTKERAELIRDALPPGARVSALSKTGADGDLHTLGCNEKHCPHYNCNTDPAAHEFCYQCEPEEDEE